MRPTLFGEEQIDAFVRAGYWREQTLSDVWDDNARDHPHHPGFVDEDEAMTWAELNRFADAAAVVLAELVPETDRMVLLMQPNWWEAYALRIALQRAGLIAVIAPLSVSPEGFAEIVRLARPAAGIFPGDEEGRALAGRAWQLAGGEDGGFRVLSVRATSSDAPTDLRQLAAARDDLSGARDRALGAFDLDVVRTTSGSTGLPKLVHNPSAPRVYVGRQQVERMAMDTGSRWLSLLGPHSGLMVPAYYSAPLVAATSYLLPRFSGDLSLEQLLATGATHAGAVPTQLSRILSAPSLVDGSTSLDELRLRTVFCGGAVLPSVVRKEFEDVTGACVMNVYGLTEGSIGMEAAPDPMSDDGLVRALITYPGVEIDIRRGDDDADIGEIWVAGPSLHSGYVGDDPAGDVYSIDDAGKLWMRTGDLGYVDDGGRLHVTGRLKEVIIRGGLNIWPAEIEKAMLEIPAVREVACVPVPDEEMGERVCACVVLDPDHDTDLDLETLRRHLDQHGLPKSHWPEYLHVMEELPLVTGQKIDRSRLRVIAADRFATTSSRPTSTARPTR